MSRVTPKTKHETLAKLAIAEDLLILNIILADFAAVLLICQIYAVELKN